MRRYETIMIANPDLSDEDRKSLLARIGAIIEQEGGFLVELDDWGVRKLAYEIRKKSRGYYVRVDYCGAGIVVSELERFFRIDDRTIKYMTVLLEDRVNLEEVKEASAAKAAAKAAQTEATAKAAQTEVAAKTPVKEEAEAEDAGIEESIEEEN